MNLCPICSRAGCRCAKERPLALIRAVIVDELDYLERTEAALRTSVSNASSPTDRLSRERLARRYRIRYLAIADMRESLERAVSAAGGEGWTAGSAVSATDAQIIPLPGRPSEPARSGADPGRIR